MQMFLIGVRDDHPTLAQFGNESLSKIRYKCFDMFVLTSRHRP